MCTPGTVARIVIDGRRLHKKRLVGKFKQRTVPVPLQKRRTVPVPLQKRRAYFLAKIETYRTVLPPLVTGNAMFVRAQTSSVN